MSFGNVTKSRNGKSPSANKNEGSDAPYIQARMVDIGSLETERRHSASWRRMCFALIAALVIVAVDIVIQNTKDHTEALVYGQDSVGHITLLGYAGHSRTPSDLAVEQQLGLWIKAVRDIPGSDDALVDRNAGQALAMLQFQSPADITYRDFIIHNNPKLLGRKQISRTVLNTSVNKITDLTWQLSWTERVVNQGTTTDRNLSGTVTLAGIPQVPTDPTIGVLNPPGVYIKTDDLKWPPV